MARTMEEGLFFNPVFVNEMRQSPMRRTPVLGVSLWLGATLLLLALAMVQEARGVLFWLPLLVMPILTPSFAAGAFAREYEQQTWQDLTLTRLTNLQVVLGKFTAALVQIGACLAIFLPAHFLALHMSPIPRILPDGMFAGDSGMEESVVIGLTSIAVMVGWMALKLAAAACLYVLLAMVCSRYCASRRTAYMWCYAAMAGYTVLWLSVWQVTVSLVYSGSRANLAISSGYLPGYMEGAHLLVALVAGFGCCFLLWVSLSEQRGYRKQEGGTDSQRAWQPIADVKTSKN